MEIGNLIEKDVRFECHMTNVHAIDERLACNWIWKDRKKGG